MRLVLAAALLALAGCGFNPEAAELDCQRRLVAMVERLPSGERGYDDTFTTAHQRLSTMPRDGCTPVQRDTADALEALSVRLASAAVRIAEARPGLWPEPSPRTRQAIAEFERLIPQFERARVALIAELRRMEAR